MSDVRSYALKNVLPKLWYKIMYIYLKQNCNMLHDYMVNQYHRSRALQGGSVYN